MAYGEYKIEWARQFGHRPNACLGAMSLDDKVTFEWDGVSQTHTMKEWIDLERQLAEAQIDIANWKYWKEQAWKTIKKADEALEKYGRHGESCEIMPEDPLARARAEAKGLENTSVHVWI